jgi:DMSO reductase family type II enzyme heme b subunit
MKSIIPAFVLSVLLSGLAFAQGGGDIRVLYRAEGVPVQPGDPAWKSAPERSLNLSPQVVVVPRGGGAVTKVSIKAIHDGRWLALRLTWQDATANQDVGTSTFRDSVAVGFPITEGETPPSPFMGEAKRPVNIWQWTADFDANAQGQGGFAERYPHTEGVWYFPQDYEVTREVRAWRGFEPVIELTARGFGTLERKVAQNVRGIGKHSNGLWSVVLRRQLSTGNPRDPLFQPGRTVQAIFAVWDGSKGEVNGRKAVTMYWTPFTLDRVSRRSG